MHSTELTMYELQKRFITPKDLERMFGIKESTQAKLRMDKKIPFIKVGKFIKYDLQDIQQ